MRVSICLAAMAMLSACSTTGVQSTLATLDAQARQLEVQNVRNSFRRVVDDNYRELPFDEGTVFVVANEHGDLHTYSLTPCHGGTRICGGSGHVGRVERTLDHFVVTGAYRDRTFYLSPGGDGFLNWRGVNRDLAWN